ncbi:hypothetical protein crov174 [Cafeteria roenbergensis virus]|uniref:Uncharacterized protein n=1 Tax=Cafeteria roenbergensis virus (strain BV-PW1) TaxID=693272 RepID=E3T4U4_CROVB|nr:hypothetical protein crov174 [Cafeteria roenbergensis virus BV-PW1]ADO67207.1 hypothetical protein crov174 [Cafeteria roenbergensis virus BV-PW1]
MSNNRNTLIDNLTKLRDNKDANIKKTAGLALAALDINKSKDTLQGLIGTHLDRFDTTTGANALSTAKLVEAIKSWLGNGIIEKGVFNNSNEKGVVNTNLLNNLAVIIASCVQGNLTKEVCKDYLSEFKESDLQNQKVNLRLTLSTLKSLGFKIYNEDNVLVAGTKNQHVVQSVDEWKMENKDKLPSELNPILLKILETFVLTANAYGSSWDTEDPVPVKVSTRKPSSDYKEKAETMVLGITSQLGGLTGYQKYYGSLLPIKAKNLGMLSLTGGAGLINYDTKTKDGLYMSYVDEQVDTNKNFVTAEVLENLFKQFRSQLENKGIKLNKDEMDKVEQKLSELKTEEVHLINLTSIIEKYLALKKYFGVEDNVTGNLNQMIEQMTKLLEEHKSKLTKVEKNRKGLGDVLLVMAQGADYDDSSF